jgi:hypothetical protein
VIDKISFAGYNQVLGGMSKTLKSFTKCHQQGDFCQLEAIGKGSDLQKPK